MTRPFNPLAYLFHLLLLASLFIGTIPLASANVADAPGNQLEIALITYGPGSIYWERFGHDAIEIRDKVTGQTASFNYGVFDFSQKHFFLNFALGHMRYTMAAEATDSEINRYIQQGRSVNRQILNLTPEQANDLRNALIVNYQPQNRPYHYDYYTRNCATRVRDIINNALDGKLNAQLDKPAPGITYREQTNRLMASQPALVLLLDLSLSGYADQPLNQWQASFIPMYLMQAIKGVTTAKGQSLVRHTTRIAKSTLPAPADHPPRLILWLLPTGLLLAIVIGLSGFYRARHKVIRLVFYSITSLWLLLAGAAGVGMGFLWLFTQHQAAWHNENLLLFNPLAWLLLPCVFRLATGRASRYIIHTIMGLTLFALIAKLIPAFNQSNIAWIALALPVWASIWYTVCFKMHRY